MPCNAIADDLLSASITVHRCHLLVSGPNFLALHAFYGEMYQKLDDWYDRMAERAIASGEELEKLTLYVPAPSGDCFGAVEYALTRVKEMAEALHAKEGPVTQAIIDELLEFIDKMLWQVNAMRGEEIEPKGKA